MSLSSRNIGIAHIADIFFCLFLIMSFLSERTILGRYSLLVFIIIVIFMIIIRGRVLKKLPFYFILEITFIAYCILQVITGVAVDETAATDMIYTLLISTLVYIFVYNYAIFRNNFKHILKLFFLSFVWAILINLIIDIDMLFDSRSGDGIEVGGIKIGGAISISVGWMAGICMVLASILYSKEEKKKFWIVTALMLLAILSSGTRKALLFVPVAMLGWLYFKQYRKNIIKLSGYTLVVLCICVIGYYITIYNSLLYSTIGYRLESVVTSLFSEQSDGIDASMQTRSSLIETAKVAVEQRPFLGWGLDNFSPVINDGGYYSHNNFLEILVSGGLIGFIIYYLKYLYVIISLWVARKSAIDRDKNWISIFLLLAITMVFLEYWQVTYYTRKFMLMWVVMVIYIQYLKVAKRLRQTQIE